MNAQEIPKTYNAQEWEDKLYDLWEKSGFFNPDVCVEKGVTEADAKPFSIVLPPPNVTGTLHTGSACMLAIEDLVVRFKRMRGYKTLWIPGTDHAAVATQSKVEKIIYKEEGKTRHDIGREELLRRIEDFAQKSHDTIIHQTKKLGSSLDWSREAYTLDKKRSLAVRTAFKKMYNEGIIFQGYRTVNWSIKGQSTLSDDEVVYKEREAKLFTFRYSKEFPIAIATTRPETKLGDTAVAVHPRDERYKQFIGQEFTVSLGTERKWKIKIITDDTVDPEFGTGAVGVTPAHSHIDYDMYVKNKELIEFTPNNSEPVIGTDGKMTLASGSEYAGLTTGEAREKIVAWLIENRLLEKEPETIMQNVGTSDRFEDVIEVLPMKQWFIGVNKEFERDGKTVTLKSLMLDAVQSGNIRILPERFEKIYFHWVNNLRDWCISRQIWYGHRIPVWYRGDEMYCGIDAPEEEGWEQDPDTLDTWFSSGLWTFSTLGWPNETNDFKIYHPTSLLETGYDILPFWVSRMILMSAYLLDKVPFNTVYLHGLVRDEQGRKMSKSLDNIIDPLDVIAEYGADALRLALVIGSTPGNDLKLGDEKIQTFRNFTNKLWNIGRYVYQATGNRQQAMEEPIARSAADHWILKRTDEVVQEVTRLIESYQLSLAGEKLRDFTWNEFADWYVEIHKVEKNNGVLRFVFETLLKLWHPYMPYVTEALWETFGKQERNLLMVEHWPEKISQEIDSAEAKRFEDIIGLIQEIRALRSHYRIDPAKFVTVSAREGLHAEALTQKAGDTFKRLARVSDVHVIQSSEALPEKSIRAQFGSLEACIELEGVIDFEAEKKRLTKEKSGKEKYISSLQAKLGNKNFVERAKPDIVVREQAKLEEAKKQLADLDHHLLSLGS